MNLLGSVGDLYCFSNTFSMLLYVAPICCPSCFLYLPNFRVRIPAKHVYYYRCPDHRKNYVMSFSFCFDKEDDVYQFAYCYPYSYTRLQNYLDNLEKKGLDFFSRELLCLTVVCVVILHTQGLTNPTAQCPGQVLSLVGLVLLMCIIL